MSDSRAIDLRLLRQFLAVAEELHFHRAAERLHMAQPPLSKAIRRLEEALGCALFKRTSRRVVLTPAGEAFRQTALETLATLERGIATTRGVADGERGVVLLGFIDLQRYAPLLDALAAQRRERPGVVLQLEELTSAEQLAALEAERLDLGVMRRPERAPDWLALEPLAIKPLRVALPLGHRLAPCRAVALADLCDEDFITTPRRLGAGYFDQLIALCHRAGFSPRQVQEARMMPTLVGLVAAGFGIALVPDSIAAVGHPGVVFRPLAQADPALARVELLLGWHRGHQNRARQRLSDEILKRFKAD